MSAASDPPRPASPGLVLALVLALVVIVYARVVDAPFVSDDRSIILDGSLARAAHPLSDYFSPFWMRSYFRPLTTLSYRMDYLLAADSAFGYHATNVVLHTLNAALLFVWVRRLGAGLLETAGITLLWAVHPCVTETVCWISARTDALAFACVLGAMLVWPEPPLRRTWRAVMAALLVFLGLLAKEVALVAVAVMLARDAVRGGWRALHPRRVLPLALAVAAYTALRWRALHGLAPTVVPRAPQPWLTLASVGSYVKISLRMRPAYLIGLPTEVDAGMIALGVVACVATTALVVVLVRRRDGARLSAVVLAVVALLPVLHIVPFPSHTLVADRYLYVPLAGVAAWVALAATGMTGRPRRVLLGLVPLAAVFLVLATWRRVDDWRDEVRFWLVSTRDASARDPMPVMNLAAVLAREQRCDRAVDLLRPLASRSTITGDRAPYQDARLNLVACLSQTGQHGEALAIARDLVQRSPDDPDTLRGLGVAAMSAQRFDEARAAFRRLMAVDPTNHDAPAWLELAAAASARLSPVAAQDATDIERVIWLQRTGADHEAGVAWRAILASPGVSPATARLAAGYLLERGPLDLARVAVQAVDERSREGATLRVALEARVRVDRQIDLARPLLATLAERELE